MIILGAGAGGMQPSAPTIGTATAGDTSASVAFTASSYIGKGTITYTATSSPGGFTATGASSPLTVTGLTNGTAYTFTVVGNTNYGVASVASAASNSVSPAASASWESIATYTSTNPAVSFTSIPSTFKHLQIRWFARTNRPDPNGYLSWRINQDSGANYGQAYWYKESGGSLSTGAGAGGTEFGTNSLGGTGAGSSWGSGEVTFFNYGSTNMNKAILQWSGDTRTNLTGDTGYHAWGYKSTSAITRVDFIAGYQVTALESGSIFALYGMKG
jgi:hypothetical protein